MLLSSGVTMEYKHYDTDTDNASTFLQTYGVASIPNVLTVTECVELRDKVWKEVSHITQNRFDINNKTTWKHFYDFFPLHSMLCQHWGLGHMQPIWDIRQHPNVRNIFEKVWETPDLLVSFDGLSIHLPPEDTKRGWYRKNIWMHTDQSSAKKGLHCIQGLINLYPVNEGDATLSILENSHLHHEEFFAQSGKSSSIDWYKLQEDELNFFETKGCQQVCLQGNEGSMFLWDSRTFHQGIEAQKTRKESNFRMAVYICMTPKKQCSAAGIKKRIAAFENMRMTTHWPHIPKLFPVSPRTYGKCVPQFNQVNAPVLSDAGRKLVGYAL